MGPEDFWIKQATAMVSVASMLRWNLPPILIMLILLLRFGTPESVVPDSLDFTEVFAGAAEISKSLRRVSELNHVL